MSALKARIAKLEGGSRSGAVVVFGGGQSPEEVDAFLEGHGVDPTKREVVVFHTIYADGNGGATLPLQPLKLVQNAA